MRVIDQALPAHGGPGFLKIDPHHDMKVFRKLLNEGPEARAILKGGRRVMNRARANDYEEAVILASQNRFRAHSGIVDQIGGLLGGREIVGQDCRRDQRVNTPDTQIICSLRRHGRNVVALLLGCKGISIPGNLVSSDKGDFGLGNRTLEFTLPL